MFSMRMTFVTSRTPWERSRRPRPRTSACTPAFAALPARFSTCRPKGLVGRHDMLVRSERGFVNFDGRVVAPDELNDNVDRWVVHDVMPVSGKAFFGDAAGTCS